MTLNRSTAARWTAEGMPAARRTTLLAVASTLGVLIPPSLVLLLLGDAMLRAHTEGLDIARALQLPLAAERIRVVNTQDVMQAVLPPGALLLIGWLRADHRRCPARRALGHWHARASRRERRSLVRGAGSAVAAAGLGGQRPRARGRGCGQRRRRAAAVGRAQPAAHAATARRGAQRCDGDHRRAVRVVVGRHHLSLLLRLLGTDRLVADAMVAFGGGSRQAVLLVLGVLLLCAFVLDAFELTFLVVPIVMPPLLSRVGDAARVSTLVLLVLQLGFLLPPFGYSVVLARGLASERPTWAAIGRPLLPLPAVAAGGDRAGGGVATTDAVDANRTIAPAAGRRDERGPRSTS